MRIHVLHKGLTLINIIMGPGSIHTRVMTLVLHNKLAEVAKTGRGQVHVRGEQLVRCLLCQSRIGSEGEGLIY